MLKGLATREILAEPHKVCRRGSVQQSCAAWERRQLQAEQNWDLGNLSASPSCPPPRPPSVGCPASSLCQNPWCRRPCDVSWSTGRSPILFSSSVSPHSTAPLQQVVASCSGSIPFFRSLSANRYASALSLTRCGFLCSATRICVVWRSRSSSVTLIDKQRISRLCWMRTDANAPLAVHSMPDSLIL